MTPSHHLDLISPATTPNDCWNRIGVWGDQSCPELVQAVHCQNCPVFAAASRRFLDAPPPGNYLTEWTERLIAPMEETANNLQSVLIFRLGEEWLALRVQVLLEVTALRPVHPVPHRAGLLAGLVNIRGELNLCVYLAQLLGIKTAEQGITSLQEKAPAHAPAGHRASDRNGGLPRMLVVERQGNRWVFPVDEVDQVYRFAPEQLTGAPATLARSARRLTRAVFAWQERSVGYLDDERLFRALHARVQ